MPKYHIESLTNHINNILGSFGYLTKAKRMSTCKECKKKIPKGEKKVTIYYEFFRYLTHYTICTDCFSKNVEEVEQALNNFKNLIDDFTNRCI